MFKISSLATLLLTISISGSAQQPSPSPTPELPVIREEVTVTATRDGLSQESSPNATSVVTLRENQIRNTSTIDQSLNLTPGVFAFRAKGLLDNEARIMIRGFSGQNRTLILFDGQPINDAQTGNVLWTMIPTSEVERVEVARGPFSALYGGNAMGGVVNIQTRPIEKRSFEGSVQYGTFDTTSYDARYSDRLWDKLGFSFGYRRLQTGGYPTRPITASATTGTTGTLVTGIIPTLTTTGTQSYIIGDSGNEWLNQHAIRFKGDFSITKDTQISGQFMRQIRANGYDNGISFVRDAAGNNVTLGPVLFNDRGTVRRFNFTPGSFLQGPGDAEINFYSGSVLHKFNERTFLQISGGVNDQPDVSFRTPNTATATASGGPGTIGQRASRNLYFNTQFNWQPLFLGGRNSFVLGTETRADESVNQDFVLTNWADRDSKTTQTSDSVGRTLNQSVYVQDQIRVRENINIVAGLRYDFWRTYDGLFNGFSTALPLTRYEPQTRNAITGKVAAIWNIGKGFAVRSSIGTAFRTPSVLDLYRNFRIGTRNFLGNPSLKPENLLSYEFGVRQTFGEKTAIEATYYRNQISDLIFRATDLANDPTGNTLININAAKGVTNGFEFSLKRQVVSWLQFRTTYSYTDAKITENPANLLSVGKRVTFTPPQMASASFLGSWKRLTGSVSGRYVAAIFSSDINSDTTKGVFGAYDPHFLADASFGVELGRGFSVFSNIENILDRKIYQFFLSPGRSANIGIRFRK